MTQASGNTPVVYSAPEIQARLQRELPHWTCADGRIRRSFKTSGWKASLMVVNAVGHLAEAAWHHPELTVAYSTVVVVLHTHDAQGVTDKDFELARKIEDLVLWRPNAPAGSALEGTPQEPRFKYVIYD